MRAKQRGRMVIRVMLLLAGTACLAVSGVAQLRTDSAEVARRDPGPLQEKDPRLAGALSVFVPGLGQMYAGETVKGVVLTGLFVGGIVAVIGADIGQTNASITPGGWSAVALVGGVYLYALIDAPFAAHRANAGREESGLLRFRAKGIAVAFDAGLRRGGAGAGIRVEF